MQGEPGFVKLKLPVNYEKEITASRVWIDACNRGLQASLVRFVSHNFGLELHILHLLTPSEMFQVGIHGAGFLNIHRSIKD